MAARHRYTWSAAYQFLWLLFLLQSARITESTCYNVTKTFKHVSESKHGREVKDAR